METTFDVDEIFIDGTYPEIEILKIHVNKDGKMNSIFIYLYVKARMDYGI